MLTCSYRASDVPSMSDAVETAISSANGLFDKLPLEIVHMIIQHCDIIKLENRAKVWVLNSWFKQTAESLEQTIAQKKYYKAEPDLPIEPAIVFGELPPGSSWIKDWWYCVESLRIDLYDMTWTLNWFKEHVEHFDRGMPDLIRPGAAVDLIRCLTGETLLKRLRRAVQVLVRFRFEASVAKRSPFDLLDGCSDEDILLVRVMAIVLDSIFRFLISARDIPIGWGASIWSNSPYNSIRAYELCLLTCGFAPMLRSFRAMMSCDRFWDSEVCSDWYDELLEIMLLRHHDSEEPVDTMPYDYTLPFNRKNFFDGTYGIHHGSHRSNMYVGDLACYPVTEMFCNNNSLGFLQRGAFCVVDDAWLTWAKSERRYDLLLDARVQKLLPDTQPVERYKDLDMVQGALDAIESSKETKASQ
jgi:hypothetical protein